MWGGALFLRAYGSQPLSSASVTWDLDTARRPSGSATCSGVHRGATGPDERSGAPRRFYRFRPDIPMLVDGVGFRGDAMPALTFDLCEHLRQPQRLGADYRNFLR